MNSYITGVFRHARLARKQFATDTARSLNPLSVPSVGEDRSRRRRGIFRLPERQLAQHAHGIARAGSCLAVSCADSSQLWPLRPC